MKNIYEGLKAVEMLKNVTNTYTTEITTYDPWWGNKVTVLTHVVIDGKTYTKETDRDGWPMLWEE